MVAVTRAEVLVAGGASRGDLRFRRDLVRMTDVPAPAVRAFIRVDRDVTTPAHVPRGVIGRIAIKMASLPFARFPAKIPLARHYDAAGEFLTRGVGFFSSESFRCRS